MTGKESNALVKVEKMYDKIVELKHHDHRMIELQKNAVNVLYYVKQLFDVKDDAVEQVNSYISMLMSEHDSKKFMAYVDIVRKIKDNEKNIKEERGKKIFVEDGRKYDTCVFCLSENGIKKFNGKDLPGMRVVVNICKECLKEIANHG